jgi:hypothetical protein
MNISYLQKYTPLPSVVHVCKLLEEKSKIVKSKESWPVLKIYDVGSLPLEGRKGVNVFSCDWLEYVGSYVFFWIMLATLLFLKLPWMEVEIVSLLDNRFVYLVSLKHLCSNLQ